MGGIYEEKTMYALGSKDCKMAAYGGLGNGIGIFIVFAFGLLPGSFCGGAAKANGIAWIKADVNENTHSCERAFS